MYATTHLDLFHAVVAERFVGTRVVEPARMPAAPARIATWGPRVSRRLAQVGTPRVVDLRTPRDLEPASALVTLDA